MAIPFLSNIDLNKNQLLNHTLHNATSNPSSPSEGQIYYNTSTDKVLVYNGSAWISIAGDITAVTSATTNQLTVANENGPAPAFSIVTGAVANGGTALATGDQIYDFVIGQNYSTTTGTVTSVTSGNANTITIGGTAADPTVAANTAAVTNGSTNLATGDQIYDFVVGYADPSGTDNSTNVTLAGSLDYITISGQVITRNAIDLATDITGTLPIANGGTGQTTAAAAANALLNTSQGGSLTIGDGSDSIVIPGDLTVTGTTTTNNVETVSTSNGVIFEGNAADENELTLLAGTLTEDRTVTLPNDTGTVALTSDISDNTITITAGNVLDGGGTFTLNGSATEITIHHADTSSQASVNNSGVTVIQDITLDTYGHVSVLGSVDLTSGINSLIDTKISATGYATTITDTATITHSLGTDVIIQLYDITTGETVYADVDRINSTQATITFASTPTNSIRVLVQQIN
jgi:hypothetical protein